MNRGKEEPNMRNNSSSRNPSFGNHSQNVDFRQQASGQIGTFSQGREVNNDVNRDNKEKDRADNWDNSSACKNHSKKEDLKQQGKRTNYNNKQLNTLVPKNYRTQMTKLNHNEIERDSREKYSKTLTSLNKFNAVKDDKLTDLEKPMLSDLHYELIKAGIKSELAYEAVILVAFFSVVSGENQVFQYFKNDIIKQNSVDAIKVQLIHSESDTLSYINIYKLWLQNNDRESWCDDNYIICKTLESVHEKVLEIYKFINDEIRQRIDTVFNPSNQAPNNLLELLLKCYRKNLCVFRGHYRSGYRLLASKSIFFLHPSSIVLCQTKDLPNFIIFDQITMPNITNRIFLKHITSIPLDMIKRAFEKGTFEGLDFEYEALFVRELIEKIVEPVSERIIKQVFLGNKGHRLKEIEKQIRCTDDDDVSVVIEPSAEKGRISVYASKACVDKAVQRINNILKEQIQISSDAEEEKNFELKKGFVTLPVKCKWSNGAIVKSIKTGMKATNEAQTSLKIDSQTENDPYTLKQSIHLTWIRRKCIGKAFVNFLPPLFPLAEKFAMAQISLLGAKVFVKADHNKSSLILLRIPPNALQHEVENSLKGIFPPFKTVKLGYEKPFETSEDDLRQVKNKIIDFCKESTDLDEYDVIVDPPEENTATIMKAYINVPKDVDIEVASKTISKHLNFFGLSCKAVYSSVITCDSKLCKITKSLLDKELEKKIYVNTQKNSIKMFTNFREELPILQRTVYNILEGDAINQNFHKDIGKLFCHGGHLFLKSLEDDSSLIISDYRNKSIKLYGSKIACCRNKELIKKFLQDCENEVVKTINLRSINGKNRTILKTLIEKYGVHLVEFISSCNLRSADLNIKLCTLLLHGSRDSVEKAEKMLSDLAKSNNISSFDHILEDVEMCPICSCQTASLTRRLELCGHLYCCGCLEGLVEQAQFPIQCCYEGCNKDISLEDIYKILGDDSDRINNLLDQAVKKYIEANPNDFGYCPAPDCPMFYNKREVNGKHYCLLCLNYVCTRCSVLYHHGMECDMYQGQKNDPHYSFRTWMKNSADCQQCPNCNAAIQKTGGCNHMTCSNCRSHFCWNCKQTFSDGGTAYNHIVKCSSYPYSQDRLFALTLQNRR